MITRLLGYTFPLFLLCFSSLPVSAQEIDTTLWITNGAVKAVTRSGNTLYLGGGFDYVGPNTGGGAVLTKSDGQVPNGPALQITGEVSAVAADGRGGWFIGGGFTYIQGTARKYLAHILPDGTLDKAWNPAPDNWVNVLTVAGNTLYAAGAFTSIGGQSRTRLAALNAATGRATGWNPAPNNQVGAMVVSGNVVYASGSFTSIGGQTRNRLAALDATTSQATAWDPAPNGAVYALAVSGGLVYAGGNFTAIGGQTRSRLAAIDQATGQATPWAPNVTGGLSPTEGVHTLAVSGGWVYAGGNFTAVDGQTRNYLAAIDQATGQVTPWNPNANTTVGDLAVSDGVAYVIGNFISVGGQMRRGIAALDAVTGQATAWSPLVSPFLGHPIYMYTLAVSGNAVFVGGSFISAGGKARRNVAALDLVTGRATDWTADMSGHVEAIDVSGNLVYLGGSFTTINSQTRKFLAALDATTGQLTAWNPNPSNTVHNLMVRNNLVYVSGWFTTIGGQARNYMAALDPATGQATPWNPNPNRPSTTTGLGISAFTVVNDVMYVVGSFTTMGGQTRNRLAALDLQTGQATAWNPGIVPIPDNINPSFPEVTCMAVLNNVMYISGNLGIVGGQYRKELAAIDLTTGQVTNWTGNPNARVRALAAMGNVVYVGGTFDYFNNKFKNKLAALDAVTGELTAWNANDNAPYVEYKDVNRLTVWGNVLYAGGSFVSFQNKAQPHFAAFGRPPAPINFIKGTVYEDADGDCVKSPSEKGVANQVVVAQPGDYFTSTDSLGNYTLAVGTGAYRIEQVIPAHKSSLVRQTCPAAPGTYPVEFATTGNTLTGKDFANQTTVKPFLTVSVASNRRRRCMTNNTSIAYCNMGTAAADSVQVHVQLPEHVGLVRAGAPYTVDKDHHYVFTIGTLGPDACGSIQLLDSVVCNNPDIRGLTQCTKVWITPANAATPSAEWDGSDVDLKADCRGNGKARLGIYNTGRESMADSSAFRILLDAQLAFAGKYKLAQGDSLILQIPVNGQTVRLEADHRPGHPRKGQSNVTFEACGTNGQGKASKGFVCRLPQDDAGPEVAVECLPIIDSYDPNDKTVSPQGVTASQYTPTGQTLDYVIRFQNTGTDVAYKVVVVDTLSGHLDISTLRMGAASHAYKLGVSGQGRPVLTFTFNNINLPDSNANEPASHGFIQFSIRPRADLPEKTRIENFADIYFDYNEPIRTNTTFNTIYDVPPVVAEAVRLDGSVVVCITTPAVQAGPSPGVLCEADSARLGATAPLQGAGRWKRVGGGGTVQEPGNPAAPVTGLAYGANVFEWSVPASTCGTDSLRASVTITRLRKPEAPAIALLGTDSLACSVAAAAYAWSLDGNPIAPATQRIKADRAGNYSVRVTTPEGCRSEASAAFAYVPTGTEAGLASRVTVHPNPTTGLVALLLPADLGPKGQLTVYDALGRAVLTRNVPPAAGEQKVELDLSAQPAGVFVLRLQTPRGIVTRRIIRLAGR